MSSIYPLLGPVGRLVGVLLLCTIGCQPADAENKGAKAQAFDMQGGNQEVEWLGEVEEELCWYWLAWDIPVSISSNVA